MKSANIVIIGGGFFGLYLAEYFSSLKKKVVVIEKENDVMQRASYLNQARVHNGYHYPRSTLTALRSRISFPIFVKEFESCIEKDFDKYYMISNRLGKVTAKQFEKFCERIGAPFAQADEKIKTLINPSMIDSVLKVKEFAFNAATLKKVMLERLQNSNIEILNSHSVKSIFKNEKSDELIVKVETELNSFSISANQVFNCTYSQINSILKNSEIELIPLKHEMTEICIVDVPDELKKLGITVMCGPFFSIMPFPDKSAHSFTHVRYTPHFEWSDNNSTEYIDSHKYFKQSLKTSAFKKMKLDAQRYIPILNDIKYKESLWEVKTILPRSDHDDSRPILFRVNHGLKGLHCIMGGKIDNVYDVIQSINELGLNK